MCILLNISPNFIDRYKYTHWWPESLGTGRDRKPQRIRYLAPPLPFTSYCDTAQAHRYFASSISLTPANTQFFGCNYANLEKPGNFSGLCSLKLK
jgi:hypothetical protein